ncbi:hypothetical protein [Fibrella aestuarina]|nr:hypothetical protein [Fibrella aestuarina]
MTRIVQFSRFTAQPERDQVTYLKQATYPAQVVNPMSDKVVWTGKLA